MQAGGGLELGHEVDRAFGDAAIALEVPDQPVDRVQVGGAFDLRQDYAFDFGVQHLVQIAEAEGARRRVHAYVAAAASRPLQRCRHALTSRGLFRERHGILQVDNHRVGVERERFLHATRDVAGGKKE